MANVLALKPAHPDNRSISCSMLAWLLAPTAWLQPARRCCRQRESDVLPLLHTRSTKITSPKRMQMPQDGSSDGDDDDDNEVPEVVPSSKKRGRGATARQGSSASKATAPSAKRSKPVAKPAAKSAAKPAAKGGGRKQAAPQPRGVSTGLSPNAVRANPAAWPVSLLRLNP